MTVIACVLPPFLRLLYKQKVLGTFEAPPCLKESGGHWSDSAGRKPLIVAGMLVQAGALGILAVSGGSVAIAIVTAALLGLGTALVYPTLIAAMSDAVTPVARAPVVGVYRFWRDMGYALGALIAGATADALGYGGAIALVAALVAASGMWVLIDMPPIEPQRLRDSTKAEEDSVLMTEFRLRA